jgi:hypothetical protein
MLHAVIMQHAVGLVRHAVGLKPPDANLGSLA